MLLRVTERAACLVHDPEATRRALLAPGVAQDGPEALIVIHAVAKERGAKHRFLNRAELLQRAVASAVLESGPRLEPVHADDVEREIKDEPGGIHEDAFAPELRTEREAPFGDVEPWLESANL